ncbi:MAG: exonuclease V subunit gamma [Sphingobacteriales bacterium]|nr:MAG: exonuclease V subunit gamma [Sphingobacteriales bacterium]
MSISIYTSNSIHILASAMVEALGERSMPVFTPRYIVTQTEGMNNWLKHQMARQLGIAANTIFLNPGAVIEQIFINLGGSYGNKIKRQHLDWLIFLILGKDSFKHQFPIQAKYYADDAMKQWEFAVKLTDLFDQYQIYRSPTISRWNELENIDPLKGDEKWQAYIWRALKRHTNNEVLDITEIKKFILEQLKAAKAQEALKQFLPELVLFGISIITPVHLELFFTLSQYIDIKWYLINPAPDDYWMDDRNEKSIFLAKVKGKNVHHLHQGNDLLTSWGSVIQNTFKMLFRTEEFINALEDLPRIVPEPKTLLGKIQQDIYYNSVATGDFSKAQLEDGTISIHEHYTMRREVEGVYNYIMNAVQQQPFGQLNERDVIVMVTDINAYAPFIRAVMDNAPYKFQYSIADEHISNGDTVISTFIALLELNGSIFSAESVLQLLNSKYIRAKFGIRNLPLLRSLMLKANIRFGIENDYGEGLDDTYLVSWKYGLQKLMYGLCMDTEAAVDFGKTFYPVDSADNVADMQQIVALTAFIEALSRMLQARKGEKTLKEWKEYVENILSNFVYEEDQERDEEHAKIINKLNQNDLVEQHTSGLKINYEVISQRFINVLSNESTQKNFLNKGITFCSPLPFRSIPFKIVAILGLNYDKFPRTEQRLDFNLMNKQPQPGDRNIKNNDKHLFLESILSASEALYLSYIGKSVKNNKVLPPSILIEELLDYIQAGNDTEAIRPLLIQSHPLHTYSAKYNKDNPALLPNYMIRVQAGWPVPEARKNEEHGSNEFELNSVWKYFNHAIEYYYTRVLQVYFEQELSEIEAAENFLLDKYQERVLLNRLMQARLEQNEPEAKNRLYLNAALPLKNIGATVLLQLEAIIQPMYESLVRHTGGIQAAEQLGITYRYREHLFRGTIRNLFGQQLIDFDWNGKLSAASRLYFNYLFARATTDHINGAQLIDASGQSKKVKPHTQAEAISILNKLLDLFIDHGEKPSLYSIYYYDHKIDKANYIEKLNKVFKDKPYNKYLGHALQTLEQEDLDETFEKMNDVINEIFLNGYEQ